MEIVGYAFRILSSQQNPYSVIWFVVQVRSSLLLRIDYLHLEEPG
jgi:hypothetical protein